MAIDTASKRFSMLNFAEDHHNLPIPDGTFDAGDRQHLLGMYASLGGGAPVVANPALQYRGFIANITRMMR